MGGVNISAMAIASINAKCNNNFPKKTISVELSNFHGEGEYLLTDENNRGIYTEYIPVLYLGHL